MKIIKKNNKLYKNLYKWKDKKWTNGYKKMYGNFMIDYFLLKMKNNYKKYNCKLKYNSW